MPSAASSPVPRPVVVRFPALGDTVLLTTLLKALSLRHGQPVDLLASGPWVRPLLRGNPHVGDIHLISSRRAPYWLTPSQWSAVRWLRAREGAPIYDCERDPHARALLARAVPDERRYLRAWDHDPGPQLHWVEWWLQIANLSPPFLSEAGSAPPPVQAPALTELYLQPADRDEAHRWLAARGLDGQPFVLIQPGHKKTHKRGRLATQQHAKHWPASHWAAVARGIAATLPQARVLICGTRQEQALVQEIVDAAAEPRVLNIAGDLPIPRLMALAERAHSMVSVDTGPAHVAAAMDCPLVVLFSAFGATRWKPRAPQADVIAVGAQDDAEMRLVDLPPEPVLAAWRSLKPRQIVAR